MFNMIEQDRTILERRNHLIMLVSWLALLVLGACCEYFWLYTGILPFIFSGCLIIGQLVLLLRKIKISDLLLLNISYTCSSLLKEGHLEMHYRGNRSSEERCVQIPICSEVNDQYSMCAPMLSLKLRAEEVGLLLLSIMHPSVKALSLASDYKFPSSIVVSSKSSGKATIIIAVRRIDFRFNVEIGTEENEYILTGRRTLTLKADGSIEKSFTFEEQRREWLEQEMDEIQRKVKEMQQELKQEREEQQQKWKQELKQWKQKMHQMMERMFDEALKKIQRKQKRERKRKWQDDDPEWRDGEYTKRQKRGDGQEQRPRNNSLPDTIPSRTGSITGYHDRLFKESPSSLSSCDELSDCTMPHSC